MNYFDNASLTKVDSRVLEVMLPYFSEIYGNASSNHDFGKKAKMAIERSIRQVSIIIILTLLSMIRNRISFQQKQKAISQIITTVKQKTYQARNGLKNQAITTNTLWYLRIKMWKVVIPLRILQILLELCKSFLKENNKKILSYPKTNQEFDIQIKNLDQKNKERICNNLGANLMCFNYDKRRMEIFVD